MSIHWKRAGSAKLQQNSIGEELVGPVLEIVSTYIVKIYMKE